MTREEEIRQAARKYFDDYMDGLNGEVLTVQQPFEEGAKWADETMLKNSREWVKNAFTGVFGEGLANSIADEFVKAMKGE